MILSLAIPAFLAGLLTFFAPCTLPLVPGYLAFISGAAANNLENPERLKSRRGRVFLNGLFFVVGFSLAFILLGLLFGLLGRAVLSYRLWLERTAGILVIAFGLSVLGVFRLPFLSRGFRLMTPAFKIRGHRLNSFVLGLSFALGWTPCIGPILGSVLLLVSSSATAFSGAFLLGIFSLGLAIPFLTAAAAVDSFSEYAAKTQPYLNIVSAVGGVFLIFLGILMLTGKLGILAPYGYRLLRFMNYPRILDYL